MELYKKLYHPEPDFSRSSTMVSKSRKKIEFEKEIFVSHITVYLFENAIKLLDLISSLKAKSET